MYYGARYYDPLLGRFISADTMVPNGYYPQDLNRYSYARNNPLKYTDPNGHCPICIAIVIVVGAYQAYDYLANPDIAYAPSESFNVEQAPDSDQPDNDLALCPTCYYVEHGQVGMAIVSGAIELTPFDEVPGVSNALRRVYKELPGTVTEGGKVFNRSDYGARFNQWAKSQGVDPLDWHRHHGLPQQFPDFFEARGIDIHDPSNMYLIEPNTHIAIHNDFQKFQGKWNDEWLAWMDSNPGATSQDIYDQLDRMAKRYGIDGYRAGAYHEP